MKATGNTILITGGGSGIGRELARRFHQLGNTVIVAGRTASKLEETRQGFSEMHAQVVDVADKSAVRGFARELIQQFPKLNVLINCAGMMKTEDILSDPIDTEIAESTINVNLLGTIWLTTALLPHLRQQIGATIVNVSSGLAFTPLFATPTYNATKAAIHVWSQSLRGRLNETPVEVVEIIPPGVQTDLMPGHASDPQMMPLEDFMSEAMELFQQSPTPDEICVDRVKFLRHAELEGRLDQTMRQLNADHR